MIYKQLLASWFSEEMSELRFQMCKEKQKQTPIHWKKKEKWKTVLFGHSVFISIRMTGNQSFLAE